MPLQRENLTSLYEQIADTLRIEVQGGFYEPSGKLPSEAELGERFGVSRVTVRLALGRLEEEGIVERKQGKGTYATGKQVRHGLDALRSFHESLLMQGLAPAMTLLSKELVATPAPWRDRLKVSRCLHVQRLHWVDDEPIALAHSYLVPELAAASWSDVESTPTYALLEQYLGRPVARADMSIRAQEADRALAHALRIKSGAALLVMTRTSYWADGVCCDCSTFYVRPERYEFVLSSGFSTRSA